MNGTIEKEQIETLKKKVLDLPPVRAEVLRQEKQKMRIPHFYTLKEGDEARLAQRLVQLFCQRKHGGFF